jgi:hypothetical protein
MQVHASKCLPQVSCLTCGYGIASTASFLHAHTPHTTHTVQWSTLAFGPPTGLGSYLTRTAFPFETCHQNATTGLYSAELFSYTVSPAGWRMCAMIRVRDAGSCMQDAGFPANSTRCCETDLSRVVFFPGGLGQGHGTVIGVVVPVPVVCDDSLFEDWSSPQWV